MKIADYGRASVDALRDELVTQVDYLAAHHVLLSGALGDHQRTYWNVYNNSTGESVSARSKEADSAALGHHINVLDIRGEINAMAVRVDLLRLLLGSDLRVSQRDSFPPDKV